MTPFGAFCLVSNKSQAGKNDSHFAAGGRDSANVKWLSPGGTVSHQQSLAKPALPAPSGLSGSREIVIQNTHIPVSAYFGEPMIFCSR